MAEPFAWSFTTTAPFVTSVTPTDLSMGIPLRQIIQITFNMPVDRESVEAAFSLSPLVPDPVPVTGEFEWAEDSTGFSFTPAERLEYFTAYSLLIEGGKVISAGGGQPMAEQFASTFTTVPPPSIINTNPFDGQTDDCARTLARIRHLLQRLRQQLHAVVPD
jgi:hypothetical protein